MHAAQIAWQCVATPQFVSNTFFGFMHTTTHTQPPEVVRLVLLTIVTATTSLFVSSILPTPGHMLFDQRSLVARLVDVSFQLNSIMHDYTSKKLFIMKINTINTLYILGRTRPVDCLIDTRTYQKSTLRFLAGLGKVLYTCMVRNNINGFPSLGSIVSITIMCLVLINVKYS